MPVIFDQYNLQIAQSLVSRKPNDAAWRKLLFYNGDHWQGGGGWIGPMPLRSDPDYLVTYSEIERTFTSRNTIGEVVDRHVAGVLARELDWKLTTKRPLGTREVVNELTGDTEIVDEELTLAEQSVITEAEQGLTVWWDKQGAPSKFQDMLRLALLTGRAPVRLYVPSGLRNVSGNVPLGNLEESLSRVWLQHLGTNEDTLELELPSAIVYTDKKTRQDIGVFTYRSAPDIPGQAVDGADCAELCYLDNFGDTVLRIIDSDGDVEEPVVLPLDGRLTIHEIKCRPLIGEQIVSQQKTLNLSETMKPRNVVLGGFLERTLLNTQLPGRFVDNGDGTKKFIADPFYVGAGTTNSLQGIIYHDAQGNEQITTPSVVYRDPVSVSTFSETSQGARLAILEATNQLHYALAGDAVVSAASRVQAQDAFQKALLESAIKVEAITRQVLETALAMASVFSGQPGRYSGLRAVVQARIDSGPISADEKRVAIELQQAGIWSTETTMSATGIEDTGSEKERIERERSEQQGKDAAAMAAVKKAMDNMNPPEKAPATGEETQNPLAATFSGQ